MGKFGQQIDNYNEISNKLDQKVKSVHEMFKNFNDIWKFQTPLNDPRDGDRPITKMMDQHELAFQ